MRSAVAVNVAAGVNAVFRQSAVAASLASALALFLPFFLLVAVMVSVSLLFDHPQYGETRFVPFIWN